MEEKKGITAMPVRPITSLLERPQRVKVRVYVVAASDLAPKDSVINMASLSSSVNSSDPYLVVQASHSFLIHPSFIPQTPTSWCRRVTTTPLLRQDCICPSADQSPLTMLVGQGAD